MIARLGNLYAYIFGWPILAKLHTRLLYLSARALGMHNHASSIVSGEKKAMRIGVHGKSVPVVFDVGANEGQWCKELLAICPSARIHAFEPQQNLAAKIKSNYPSVAVNNMALGDVAGALQLFDYADQPGSQHASLLRGVIDGLHHGNARSESVTVGTLDDYCTQHEVGHIDLLKIDVEGFELKVLLGAKRMLTENRIDVIQFEFNEMNVLEKIFMRDFFDLLPCSYQFFRLLPHGFLRINPRQIWINEQFVYQNIVAVRTK